MKIVVVAALIFVVAAPAHAMHISEGILPLGWAGLWFAVAAPFLAIGLKKLNAASSDDLSYKPLVGLMAAVVFIISCMPIPVPSAGTCSHPCGTGISAIIVGPAVSVVLTTVALLIQALVLSHGGLSTLGADVISMGVFGSFSAWFVYRGLRAAGAGRGVSAFAAGIAADWMTYLATAAILGAGIRGEEALLPLIGKIVIAFIPTQLPLGILEGAMTAGMVTLLGKKRPDLLAKMRVP